MMRNIIANFIGKIACGLASIVAAPLVVRDLGTEAYGIVSFALAIQALVAIFDMGLAATVKRELAGSVALAKPLSDRAKLLRTFEFAYWVAAVLVGGILLCLAPVIAQKGLKLSLISVAEAERALCMASIVVALRWPVALYGGVLLALNSQVKYNLCNSSFFALRTLGAVFALKWFTPNIETYFTWFIAASILEALMFVYLAWFKVGIKFIFLFPPKWTIILKSWQFSFSFSVVGALGMVASAVDRFFLASRAGASELGAYALASTPAGLLMMVGTAVSVAFFPEAAGLWAKGEKIRLAESLFRATSRVALAAMGAVLILFFAADGVMNFWINDHALANQVGTCLPWLSAAFFFNALSNPSYTLLISCGQTRLPLIWNLVNLTLGGVAIFAAASKGATAVAMVVALMNGIGLITMATGALHLTGTTSIGHHFMIRSIWPIIFPVIFGILAVLSIKYIPGILGLILACNLAAGGTVAGIVVAEHLQEKKVDDQSKAKELLNAE